MCSGVVNSLYLSHNTNMKKLALINIDGTIFRRNLIAEIIETLIAREVVPDSVARDLAMLFKTPSLSLVSSISPSSSTTSVSSAPSAKYKIQNKEFSNKELESRQGNFNENLMALFADTVRGLAYTDFLDASKEAIDGLMYRRYSYSKSLIEDLHQKDYFIVGYSLAPKASLRSLTRKIGFDKTYGLLYELGPTDRFTGNTLDAELSKDIPALLRRILSKESVTLKGSIGLGQTRGDIAVLEHMEKVVCFNPDPELYRYAKRKRYEIVAETNGVVYKIN